MCVCVRGGGKAGASKSGSARSVEMKRKRKHEIERSGVQKDERCVGAGYVCVCVCVKNEKSRWREKRNRMLMNLESIPDRRVSSYLTLLFFPKLMAAFCFIIRRISR